MCMMDDVAQFCYRKLSPEEAKVYQEYLNDQRQEKKIKKCCETCKYYSQDFSVGAVWCENNDPRWTDEEIIKYAEDGEEGCPYWEEDEE